METAGVRAIDRDAERATARRRCQTTMSN